MGLRSWVRRHRVLAAFAAGVLVTAGALAVAGYVVLSDQRRTARLVAAALSQALDREVRIARVTDVGTDRLVLRGVELPTEGGWPARVVAERVEATGPLLTLARGGEGGAVRLEVVGPTVELPGGGGAGLDPSALEGAGRGLAGFLQRSLALDVRLGGGIARHAGGTLPFDLVLVKSRGEARGELTLGDPAAGPLVLTVQGHVADNTPRLVVTGRGPLAPVAALLPGPAAAFRGRALELRLDVDLGSAVTARGQVSLGDGLAAAGTVTVAGGRLEATLDRASADLALAAALAGVEWAPTGRAELSGFTLAWASGAPQPTVRTTLRVPAARIPAAAAGTEIAVDGLEARLAYEPEPGGAVAAGDLRAARLAAVGLEAAPVETRYRVAFAPGGRPARLALDGLALRLDGAALRGSAAYAVPARQLEARLEGDDVEAAGLVRRLLPGWLDATERLRVQGLAVTATGVDPGLEAGTTRLEARGLRWQRPGGELTTGRATARADLVKGGVGLALELERLASTLAVLPGEVPRLVASADLGRRPDTSLEPRRAALAARDRQGRELIVADLQPARTAGRFRLAARAPALERLDGLWPSVPRQLTGSARLDLELAGAGYRAADGKLALEIPEGELRGRKISIRELAADVPIRRGAEFPGEPPWGRLDIGELIAYGVVARDVTTPARIFRDRLSLNDLAYVLYSGTGKGFTEVEQEPAGLMARGKLTGEGVRIEEFMGAYGIRGGTMTGLLRYQVDYQYRAGRLALKGRFDVPEGGTVNIELLNRLLSYAGSDPTGVVRRAVENLRTFEYKAAEAEVQTVGEEITVGLALRGRERFLIFPPRVKEINVRNLPLSFLARQFPGSFN
jgi:hypothetical protein